MRRRTQFAGLFLALALTPSVRAQATADSPTGNEGFNLRQRFNEHWSWRPVASCQAPKVVDQDWPLSPIDRFILAKIEEVGLRPAKPAEKRTWIRRVYLDLLGLPPTPEQIAEFLANESRDAHQELVKQLLDSPHFGEKWARHWMDLVRYCETTGHENNYPIEHAFEYRDYVIRALNADVPYDQFVREHLAGDLLPKPRRHPVEDYNESVIGTGFWYFHQSAPFPPDPIGNEADIIDNQLDVFGKTFLGLTIACARCHDHKSDAISTRDYYALSAYLRSSCRQTALLDPRREIETVNGKIESRLQHARSALRRGQAISGPPPAAYHEAAVELRARAEAEQESTDVKPEWIDQAATAAGLDRGRLERWVQHAKGIQNFVERKREDEKAVLFQAFNSWPDTWSASGRAFEAIPERMHAVDGTLLTSGTVSSRRLGGKQQGTLRSPPFEITAPNVHMRVRASPNIRLRVVIDSYQLARYRGLLFEGTVIQDKQSDTGGNWAWKSFGGDLRRYIGHQAYLEFIDDGDGFIEIDEIWFSDHGVPQESPIEFTADADSVAARWKVAMDKLRAGRIDPFLGSLLEKGLVSVEELSAEAAAALAEAAKLAEQVPAPRPVLAMVEGIPEKAPVYLRGDHTTPGELVSARSLEALGGGEGNRLELAEAVASADNPLIARVIVNRLWHHLLGRGLVPTVDDFGPQGEPPSHPELLDWLAADFMRCGWSLKHTISEIVLSQTYRQQCVPHPDLGAQRIAQTDPSNILLHQMPIRRMSSEVMRDSILLVSGRLDPSRFGPSVPVHLTPFMLDCEQPKEVGPIDGAGRRSIYQKIDRNFLNPLMLAFDMPSPFGTQGRRSQSNVPAQALSLLNDPFVAEQAERWADRVLAIPDLNDHERAAWMMQEAHGIPPSDRQSAAMEAFLAQQSNEYGARDRRAWADLGHALFNMKGCYYVR